MKSLTHNFLYVILLFSLSATYNLRSLSWKDIKVLFSNPIEHSENKAKQEKLALAVAEEKLAEEKKYFDEMRKKTEKQREQLEEQLKETFDLFSSPNKYQEFKKSKQTEIDKLQEKIKILSRAGKDVKEIQQSLTYFPEKSLTQYLSGLDINYNAYRSEFEKNKSDTAVIKLYAQYIDLGTEHIYNFNELAKTLEEKIKILEK